ncbi:MAG: ATP-binding cassette domain-containing protein [Flavobacteriales bacterium]|nr:ATP-binding cassette domain-containing protein [Flavobacteriales bacterium]
MRSLAHLNKYFWRYRVRFLLGILFVTISNVYAILPPKIVRLAFDLMQEISVIDVHFANTPFKSYLSDTAISIWFFFGFVIVLAAVFKGIFMFLMRQTIVVMSRMIEFDLKNEIYHHYQQLSLAFFKRNNTGDLMTRITEDVTKVRMYLGPAVLYAINLSVLVVLVVYNMLSVSPKLTAYVLAPLPVLSITIYYVSRMINIRSERVQRQLSALSTFVQEGFSGIRVLKAYAKEEMWSDVFEKETEKYKDTSLELVRINALFFPTMLTLIGLSTLLTVYVGGMQSMSGEVTVGNIAEFIIYINMLTWPFAAIGWITSIVQRAAASQTRINEFLSTEPEIVNTVEQRTDVKGNITFKDVEFVYPDSGTRALNGINFEVKQGESLAILGRTGSGKSTIASLITRTYDATSGQVLIDGKPIQELNLTSVRSSIGYVPQDVFLFSESISRNIAFGDAMGTMTEEQVHQAAKQADIYDNIIEFPKGFDTHIGERGITLSGGQKQRISIARAIIRDPEILIFDDCLSAVDTETEEKILGHLKDLMKGKTTIIISHRVSSVKHADQIVMLDKGRIIERGNHQQLLDLNGAYAELYHKQLLEDDQRKTA